MRLIPQGLTVPRNGQLRQTMLLYASNAYIAHDLHSRHPPSPLADGGLIHHIVTYTVRDMSCFPEAPLDTLQKAAGKLLHKIPHERNLKLITTLTNLQEKGVPLALGTVGVGSEVAGMVLHDVMEVAKKRIYVGTNVEHSYHLCEKKAYRDDMRSVLKPPAPSLPNLILGKPSVEGMALDSQSTQLVVMPRVDVLVAKLRVEVNPRRMFVNGPEIKIDLAENEYEQTMICVKFSIPKLVVLVANKKMSKGDQERYSGVAVADLKELGYVCHCSERGGASFGGVCAGEDIVITAFRCEQRGSERSNTKAEELAPDLLHRTLNSMKIDNVKPFLDFLPKLKPEGKPSTNLPPGIGEHPRRSWGLRFQEMHLEIFRRRNLRWPPDLTELTSQNLVDSTELSLLTPRQQEIVYFLEHNDPSGDDGTQPDMNEEQREKESDYTVDLGLSLKACGVVDGMLYKNSFPPLTALSCIWVRKLGRVVRHRELLHGLLGTTTGLEEIYVNDKEVLASVISGYMLAAVFLGCFSVFDF